jgi:hypothetical protein
LQTQVDILDSEVADLQEQITNLGASTSEVSVYELMTNSGPQRSVWNATSGSAPGPTDYSIIVSGNVTSSFPTGTKLSFYNPPTNAWFYGVVEESFFSGGSTTIGVLNVNPTEYPNGNSWQDSPSAFPVYKGDMEVSEYNFTTTLTLQNDAYWKFSDINYKYWSKIKASFVVNEPWHSGTIQPFQITNSTTAQVIFLRAIPCGCFVDMELSFEKQWNGTAYDTVTLIDFKYNTSKNIALSQDSELLFGGYSGFNPVFAYGLDLYNTNSFRSEIAIDDVDQSSVSVQDVVNSQGIENSNRKISRYAKGPSYPNASAPNFFTGATPETIVFNSTNSNITLLNIEQSFGKMPVSLA